VTNPVVATPASVAPARSTTTVGHRATTTTTIASRYPPIQDGDARIIVVLDDDGLHAPATVRVGPSLSIEVLLLDKRSNKSTNPNVVSTAYVYTLEGPLGGAAWDGSQAPLTGYLVEPGHAYTLQAVDETGANDIPGATATFTVLAG
jgi:hypothetical protein